MLISCLLLALSAQAKGADPAGWTESRFHRVHLRNGNFIDGELVRQTPGTVYLRLKSGEMGIRRDLILRVEYVKMRGIQEKPDEVAGPKPAPLVPEIAAKPSTPPKSAVKRPPAEGAYPASEALRARVDPVLEKLQRADPGMIDALIQQLVGMEPEAHAYLASQLEVAPRPLVPLLGSALSRTKSPLAAPYLSRLISHEDPQVRMQAVVGLASNGEASDAPAVYPLLRDADAALRSMAVGTLRVLGEADAFDVLAPLCADPDRETRTQALSVLAALAAKFELQEELLNTLTDAARGAPEDHVIDLVGALAATKNVEAAEALVPHLRHERAEVRAAVANGLSDLGAKDAAEEVASQMAREEDPTVRTALANAAGRLGAADALEVLAAWLDDESELVKTASRQALKAISKTDFGFDREKWEAWIEANGKK